MFNLAYKFVGKHDEAEDLTQDIFLKIFKALLTEPLNSTTSLRQLNVPVPETGSASSGHLRSSDTSFNSSCRPFWRLSKN